MVLVGGPIRGQDSCRAEVGVVRGLVVAWKFRVGVDGAERSSRLTGAVQGLVHRPTFRGCQGCTETASKFKQLHRLCSLQTRYRLLNKDMFFGRESATACYYQLLRGDEENNNAISVPFRTSSSPGAPKGSSDLTRAWAWALFRLLRPGLQPFSIAGYRRKEESILRHFSISNSIRMPARSHRSDHDNAGRAPTT